MLQDMLHFFAHQHDETGKSNLIQQPSAKFMVLSESTAVQAWKQRR
jgi:hypothetical protein